jgi:hypothetical protein
LIKEEIKKKMNSGNAYYHTVPNLLSSRLLQKNLKVRMYKNTILPLVLYGSETCSLTLWEKYKLRVCENMVLKRIFGPKRDVVTRGWRKLHNEELCDFYSSPSVIKFIKPRMRWAGHVARMDEKRNVYRLLVGKPRGKRTLGRLIHRWIGKFKTDILEI